MTLPPSSTPWIKCSTGVGVAAADTGAGAAAADTGAGVAAAGTGVGVAAAGLGVGVAAADIGAGAADGNVKFQLLLNRRARPRKAVGPSFCAYRPVPRRREPSPEVRLLT